ncbi:MAG TPA: hypothetical protein VNM90_04745 [Haliangium sp.]|nr:hypothetical protein [Haliangium sp.]
MPVRYMVLAATAVAVLGALVILLVEVRASPEIEIPETALAEARARYQRHQSAMERVADAPSMPMPAVTRRTPPAPAPQPEQPAPIPMPEPSTPMIDPSVDPAAAATDAEAEERMARLREREEMRPEIRERREVVRQYYDEGNYEMALSEARTLIPQAPTNRYVLRVAVTSACALGDKAVANEYYSQLFRDEDRRIVRVRCSRYGVEF